MALTHSPGGRGAVLEPADAPRRLPKQSRSGGPVLGVTAMAAALGATTGLTAAPAAAAEPAAPAPAVSAPDTDPGLALAARIQQQADPARGDAQEAARPDAAPQQEAAQQEAERAARLEAAHEAAAKRAAQRAATERSAAERAAAEQRAAEQPAVEQPAVEQPTADPVAADPAGAGATLLPLADHPVDPPTATPWDGLRTGIDFSAPVSTPVRAVAGGTVSAAGWSGRYGYRVVQTLPDGTEVWYCQLSAITATAGELAAGDPLGRVGATGSGTTAPRLHLEVRPGGGAPVDAAAWFRDRGVTV